MQINRKPTPKGVFPAGDFGVFDDSTYHISKNAGVMCFYNRSNEKHLVLGICAINGRASRGDLDGFGGRIDKDYHYTLAQQLGVPVHIVAAAYEWLQEGKGYVDQEIRQGTSQYSRLIQMINYLRTCKYFFVGSVPCWIMNSDVPPGLRPNIIGIQSNPGCEMMGLAEFKWSNVVKRILDNYKDAQGTEYHQPYNYRVHKDLWLSDRGYTNHFTGKHVYTSYKACSLVASLLRISTKLYRAGHLF